MTTKMSKSLLNLTTRMKRLEFVRERSRLLILITQEHIFPLRMKSRKKKRRRVRGKSPKRRKRLKSMDHNIVMNNKMKKRINNRNLQHSMRV